MARTLGTWEAIAPLSETTGWAIESKGADGRYTEVCEFFFAYEEDGVDQPAIRRPNDEDNAKFIVRAVNAHDDMLAVLKAVSLYPAFAGSMGEMLKNMVDAVIAKAEGN